MAAFAQEVTLLLGDGSGGHHHHPHQLLHPLRLVVLGPFSGGRQGAQPSGRLSGPGGDRRLPDYVYLDCPGNPGVADQVPTADIRGQH